MSLIDILRDDPEISYLRNKCYELTGEWIPYHWDCFNGIEDYKKHMRKIVEENKTTSQ